MLNLFHAAGMQNYLRRFDAAFAAYAGPKPRAMYHDSYEYRSDWAPDLFEQFARRRGYRLETELPALFAGSTPASATERERRRAGPEPATHSPALLSLAAERDTNRAARVKCDYRETLSDIMAEETLPMWAAWCRQQGFLTRNEAHGSPGNLLDLQLISSERFAP